MAKKCGTIIKRILADEKAQLLLLGMVALLVRCVYWLIAPPASAADSGLFLSSAQGVLHGDFSLLIEWPFHAVYSLLLVPGYLLPDSLWWYIPLLHIFLSTLSVILLYLISQQVTLDRQVHTLVGLLGVFYPGLLFWMKYILTETPFIFFSLLFVYLFIITLQHPTRNKYILLGLTALVLLFSRPTSLGILVVSLVIMIAVLIRRRHPGRWAIITGAIVAGGLILLLSILALPGVSQRVLRIPSIAQSLWLSTRVVAGTAEELDRYLYVPAEISKLPIDAQWQYKTDYALNFIRTQRLKYIWMAIQRFINWGYPWLHPQWSLRHRAFDALLSIGMTLMAIVGLRVTENKKIAVLIVGLALTFGLLTAFSQIDTDGRYRLPAEVLLIPVASIGVVHIERQLLVSSSRMINRFRKTNSPV